MTLPATVDRNPTEIGFPPTLPLELAAKTMPLDDLLEGYGITAARWGELQDNPAFQQACADAVKIVSEPGGAFKIKARAVAESLLPRILELTQTNDFESVPAKVQADLILGVTKVAGLDASIEQKGAAQGKAIAQNPLQIQINLR